MKSCVAVGEHLATVRGAEQETPDLLQVLWAAGRPRAEGVCVYVRVRVHTSDGVGEART